MVRLVLDTNIVISALLWRGPPHDLLGLAATRLIAELIDVLARPKFGPAVSASKLTCQQLAELCCQIATVIRPATIPPTVLRDPDDDHVLACALTAQADYIVTGDKDLLDLKQFHTVPILTAEAAIRTIG